MRPPKVKVRFLSDDARKLGLPRQGYKGDAGADLFVVLTDEHDKEHGRQIFPGERVLISAGIHIEIEEGFWARVAHRSSTERRLRLRVIEGTIDNGYRGEIFVQVANENSFPVSVHHGDRIAQLILMPVIDPIFEEVKELAESERGKRGFGSTGHGNGVRSLTNETRSV